MGVSAAHPPRSHPGGLSTFSNLIFWVRYHPDKRPPSAQCFPQCSGEGAGGTPLRGTVAL